MRLILGVVLVVTLNAVCFGRDAESDNLITALCKKHNLFDIYRIKKMTFTFNVQLPDKTVKRQWEWHVSTNKIFLDGSEHSVSPKFINDVYWLLFPLKVHESRAGITLSTNKNVPSPIAKKTSTELIIQYTDGKGYTPNDTYKLYIDENDLITEWVYLQGSKEPPARITSWENYTDINGILLSLSRKGNDDFKVWFTDVSIEK